jgi:hypothetical protein
MKKPIALALALILLLLSLTGCGTYSGITKPTKPTLPNSPENPGNPENPEEPKEDIPFTVTLVFEDTPFVDTDGMYAQWTRDGEIHRAEFIYNEKTGISTATVTGLDGDYAVTLLNLPSSYMYDANAHTATNHNRNTVIEVFKFYKNGTRPGSNEYDKAIKISRVGAYTATITEKQPFMFFEFTPSAAGTYVVTTICDINANEINPSFDIYTGNTSAKYFSHTVDSGASEASYTRNVRYEYTVLNDGIGNCITFKVTASHKENVYPMNVSFLIKYLAPDDTRDKHGIKTDKLIITESEDTYNVTTGVQVNREFLEGAALLNEKMQSATELIGKLYLTKGDYILLEMTFTKTSTDAEEEKTGETVGSLFVKEVGVNINVGGTYVYVINKEDKISLYNSVTKFFANEKLLAERGDIIGPTGTMMNPEIFVSTGIYRFDGSMFGLNPDDGYYHLYNEKTGKYDGPILYAKIQKETRFFGRYTPQGSPLPYEIAFVGGYDYVCKNCGYTFTTDATKCSSCGAAAETFGVVNIESPGNKMLHSLSEGTEDYSAFIESYAQYVNQETNPDGVYPVDEDLKIFLQKFAISGRYFMDGNGWAETNAEDALGFRLYSSEEDQWLFACCYYV